MQIDHGGGQPPVAHQYLDSTDIVTGLQEVCGKAVPEGVDTGSFLNAGFFSGFLIDDAHGLIGEYLVFSVLIG